MEYWDFIYGVFEFTGLCRYCYGEDADTKFENPIIIDNVEYKSISFWIDDDDDCKGRIICHLHTVPGPSLGGPNDYQKKIDYIYKEDLLRVFEEYKKSYNKQ